MASAPNILLTIADDQRHSALGCSQAPTAESVRTPHLDALAARGTLMSHAYHAGAFCGAVCLPSRAMLHSGCDSLGVPRALGGPSDVACPPLLGEQLRDAGYHTHGVGKWHNQAEPFQRSFNTGDSVFLGGMGDQWNLPLQKWDGQTMTPPQSSLNAHATNCFTEAAVMFLQRYAAGEFGDRPFFLYVAYTAPHDPRQTHREFHERYPADDIELPPNFAPTPRFDSGFLNGRDEMLAPLPRPERLVKQEIADYYAMTEHMDHGLGRIYAVMEDLGLTENTLTVHTADHGLAVGQHGLMGKQNLYDHSIRVPLIAAGPGVEAGRVNDALCYQHDLYPTLLEAAGCDVTTHTGFRSLTDELCGNADPARCRGLVTSYYTDTQRVVTDGKHKLIVYRPPLQAQAHWFDLEADPWEMQYEVLDPKALSAEQQTFWDALPPVCTQM